MMAFGFSPIFFAKARVPIALRERSHIQVGHGVPPTRTVPCAVRIPNIIRQIFPRRAEQEARSSAEPSSDELSGSNLKLPKTETRTVPPTRKKPDPRRVLIVSGGGLLGEEIAKSIKASGERYFVIGVVRSSSNHSNCYDRIITMEDIPSQTKVLGETVRELRAGIIVWCARSRSAEQAPMQLDFAAVRDLVTDLASDWLTDADDNEELVDFAKAQHRAAFVEKDDRVMGGRSKSQLRPGSHRCPGLWTGVLSEEDGGGFCSMRAALPVTGTMQGCGVDLSSCEGIAITCRGDGRRYKINLRNNESQEHSFQASFDTAPGHAEWQTVRVPFTDFVPVRRRELLYADDNAKGAVYTYTLDTSAITSVGLVCSKVEAGGMINPSFVSGPFELELARIEAYRYATPRFVLVSSAAVTRPFWSAEKARLYKTASEIPIVKLNPTIGNVLGAKLAGENALRATGIPYTIVRPTEVTVDAPTGRKLLLGQGDVITGRVSPADIARFIRIILRLEEATWKTFEVSGGTQEADDSEFFSDVTQALNRFAPDSEQVLFQDAVVSKSLT